jgi:anti-sigma factor RsiW
MTCKNALALLDDLLDSEITPHEAGELHKHLNECSACRNEYETSKALKELLSKTPTPDPGAEYWQEVVDIILARTTASTKSRTSLDKTPVAINKKKQALIRALVSVAASLLILFSAILLDISRNEQKAQAPESNPRLFVAAPLQDVIYGQSSQYVTRREQIRLTKGMWLLGPPGFLGRFSMLPDMTAAITND